MRRKKLIVCLCFLLFVSRSMAQNWEELGFELNSQGFNARVFCMASGKSDLYAAGSFRNQYGQSYVARWAGNGWEELGKGENSLKANSHIYSVCVDSIGNVYAAGAFKNSNGKFFVSRWNGIKWEELGSGSMALNANAPVYTLVADAQGNIYAAGNFTNKQDYNYVAKWNGTGWTELGSGSGALNANADIACLLMDADGNLLTGGSFRNISGNCYVAKWNGQKWNELGTLNADAAIKCMVLNADDQLCVAGQFSNAQKQRYIACWNGSSWSSYLGFSMTGYISAMAIDNIGGFYVTGDTKASSGSTRLINRWNGSYWTQIYNYSVNNADQSSVIPFLHSDRDGRIYTCQANTDINSRYFITVWFGSLEWKIMDADFPLLSGKDLGVSRVIEDRKGNIYAACGSKSNGNLFSVMKFNGMTWEPLGKGQKGRYTDEYIYSMVLDSQDNLYVAGYKAAYKEYIVMKWDGVDWTVVGDLKVNGPIRALAVDKYNNLYASGMFRDGEYGEFYVAKWNGSSWSRLSNNDYFFKGYLYALACDDSGYVYTAGSHADSTNTRFIAKWNGSKWVRVGEGVSSGIPATNGDILDIEIDANNNMYAAGSFYTGTSSLDTRLNVYKWDGISWEQLGAGTNGLNGNNIIIDLESDLSGNIYAAGNFTNTSGHAYVARWNGISWKELGGTNQSVFDLNIASIYCRKDGTVVSGGGYLNPMSATWIGAFDGKTWKEIKGPKSSNMLGADATIFCLQKDVKGNIYAAGAFKNEYGKYYVARWNESKWEELGGTAGSLDANGVIYCLAADASGNLYAAGEFRNSQGEYYVARWNGKKWSELGSLGSSGNIRTIAINKAGNIFAAGGFKDANAYRYVARWNGFSWLEYGDGTLFAGDDILSMVFNSDDKLYVAGKFANAKSRTYVASCSGTDWTALGTGAAIADAAGPINCLLADKENNIYAAGAFLDNPYNIVVKWDGQNYTELNKGADQSKILSDADPVFGLAIDANGQVYAAGQLRKDSRQTVRKWDGEEWTFLENSSQFAPANGNIYALMTDNKNRLYAAGAFINKDGNPYVARWSKTANTSVGPVKDDRSGIVVFPNPASAYLNIHSDSPIEHIVVYNQLGQEQIQSTAVGQIDISALAPGIYVASIQAADKTTYRIQFIKF